MTMNIPVGLVFFASLYIAVIVVFKLIPGESCLDEPCQSEGVDDSVANWGSDFFVAGACLLFGVHLQVFRNGARKTAILAQIFVAASFILMGQTHMLHGNDGSTDNTGLKSFWVITAISSYALAFSACCHSSFAIQVAASRKTLNASFVYFILARVLTVAMCAAAMAVIAGCAWCATSPELQTDQVRDFDADSADFSENPRCIQIVRTSTPAMWFVYALLWIPMSGLLRGASRELSQNILGLPTGRAALLASVFQWSTGSMFLVIISAISWYQDLGANFIELWDKVYGAEIFHFGILMTMYCAHNLAWTFPTSAVAFSEKYISENESRSSSTEGDEEEPRIQVTDAKAAVAEQPATGGRFRRKRKNNPPNPPKQESYDQDDGEISLWALLSYQNKDETESRTGRRNDVSMLTTPTALPTGEEETVSDDTSQTGNWVTNTIENFFLGPKPKPQKLVLEKIVEEQPAPEEDYVVTEMEEAPPSPPPKAKVYFPWQKRS